MNTGRYTLKSFLTDHNLDQIIIPEIQRDYVWQEENVKKLLISIKENSEDRTTILKELMMIYLINLLPKQEQH